MPANTANSTTMSSDAMILKLIKKMGHRVQAAFEMYTKSDPVLEDTVKL